MGRTCHAGRRLRVGDDRQQHVNVPQGVVSDRARAEDARLLLGPRVVDLSVRITNGMDLLRRRKTTC